MMNNKQENAVKTFRFHFRKLDEGGQCYEQKALSDFPH